MGPPLNRCVIECTEDGRSCIVDWDAVKLEINVGSYSYSFPLSRCYLRSKWVQGDVLYAVLSVRGFSDWTWTLKERVDPSDDDAPAKSPVLRGATNIEKLERVLERFGAQHSPVGAQMAVIKVNALALLDDKVFPGTLEDGYEASSPPGTMYRTLSHFGSPTSDAPEPDRVTAIAAPDGAGSSFFKVPLPYRMLATCCGDPHRAWKISTLRAEVLSSNVLWDEEPLLARLLLTFRHGQAENAGLSPKGNSQIHATTNLINLLTGGFHRVYSIYSSTDGPAAVSANAVEAVAREIGTGFKSQFRRCHQPAFNEYLPPGSYEADEVTRVFMADEAKKADRARIVFSAALRGHLMPEADGKRRFNPADLCGSEALLSPTSKGDLKGRFRFPALVGPPLKFGGIFLGRAPATLSGAEKGHEVDLYCGSANALRHQIFEELGFPKNFWKHVGLPNGALVPIGLHLDGRPSMIVADAAATLFPCRQSDAFIDSVPTPVGTLTFSPLIEGNGRRSPQLWRDEEGVGRVCDTMGETKVDLAGVLSPDGGPPLNIRYNVGSINENPARQILLIRTGHNLERDGKDMGLTKVGQNQIALQSSWIADYFRVHQRADADLKWCIAGLTSKYSTVEQSLKESVLIFKAIFSKLLSDTKESKIPEDFEQLFPENLFRVDLGHQPNLFIIFADAYHCLKYFGAALGSECSVLRHCFWPHGGSVLINLTAEGWPFFPIFGMVSHISPTLITYKAADGQPDLRRINLGNSPLADAMPFREPLKQAPVPRATPSTAARRSSSVSSLGRKISSIPNVAAQKSLSASSPSQGSEDSSESSQPPFKGPDDRSRQLQHLPMTSQSSEDSHSTEHHRGRSIEMDASSVENAVAPNQNISWRSGNTRGLSPEQSMSPLERQDLLSPPSSASPSVDGSPFRQASENSMDKSLAMSDHNSYNPRPAKIPSRKIKLSTDAFDYGLAGHSKASSRGSMAESDATTPNSLMSSISRGQKKILSSPDS